MDDGNHTFSYEIIEGNLPVRNYIAGVRLYRVTHGNRTFAGWWADWQGLSLFFKRTEPVPVRAGFYVDNMGMQLGFAAKRPRFSNRLRLVPRYLQDLRRATAELPGSP